MCFSGDVREEFTRIGSLLSFGLVLAVLFVASPASADSGESALVRFLSGKEIFRQELLPKEEDFLAETKDKSREERAVWLQSYIGEELAERLLDEMLPKLSDREKLAVEGKIQARFLGALRKIDTLEKKRIESELEKLEREVIQEIESELPDRQLRIEQLKQMLAIYRETAQFEKDYPEEQEKLRLAIAKSFLKNWLIHRKLYQRYGGRVVLRNTGPFPLDAMRDFLKEQKTKGEFRVSNKKLERAMWLFFLDWNKHLFLPEEEGALAMKNPAWFVQ